MQRSFEESYFTLCSFSGSKSSILHLEDCKHFPSLISFAYLVIVQSKTQFSHLFGWWQSLPGRDKGACTPVLLKWCIIMQASCMKPHYWEIWICTLFLPLLRGIIWAWRNNGSQMYYIEHRAEVLIFSLPEPFTDIYEVSRSFTSSCREYWVDDRPTALVVGILSRPWAAHSYRTPAAPQVCCGILWASRLPPAPSREREVCSLPPSKQSNPAMGDTCFWCRKPVPPLHLF